MSKTIRDTLIQRSVDIPVQTRMDDEQGSPVLEGYGAVFYKEGDPGTEFKLWDGVVERLMPTAFDGLTDQDVRACFNHNMDQLLGRTAAGTLRLSVDETGLKYEVDINPDDPMAMGVHARVKRGDVDGSSFWFYIESETRKEEEGGQVVYEINKVRLVEVGPVSMPAYAGTSAEARAAHLEARKADLEAMRQEDQPAVVDLLDMDLELIKRKQR